MVLLALILFLFSTQVIAFQSEYHDSNHQVKPRAKNHVVENDAINLTMSGEAETLTRMEGNPIIQELHPFRPLSAMSLQSTFGFATYHANVRDDGSVWIDPTASGTAFRIVPGLAGTGVSFQSVDKPTYYLRHSGSKLWLHKYQSTELFRLDSSFIPVTGLADSYALSFESVNFPNFFIRHEGLRLRISGNDQKDLFMREASWTIQILM